MKLFLPFETTFGEKVWLSLDHIIAVYQPKDKPDECNIVMANEVLYTVKDTADHIILSMTLLRGQRP